MLSRGSINVVDTLLFGLIFSVPLGTFFFILSQVPSIIGFDAASPVIVAGCIYPLTVALRSGTGRNKRTAVDRVKGMVSFMTGTFTALGLSTILIPSAASFKATVGISAAVPIAGIGVVIAYIFAKKISLDFNSEFDNKTSMSIISSAGASFLCAITAIMAVTIITNAILIWSPIVIAAYGVFSWGALMPFLLFVILDRLGCVIRTIPGDMALFITRNRRITSKVNSLMLSAFLASLITTTLGLSVFVLGFGSLPLMLIAIFHPLGWWFSAYLAVLGDACLVAAAIIYIRVTRQEYIEKIVEKTRIRMPDPNPESMTA